jgi:hypothetical protein
VPITVDACGHQRRARCRSLAMHAACGLRGEQGDELGPGEPESKGEDAIGTWRAIEGNEDLLHHGLLSGNHSRAARRLLRKKGRLGSLQIAKASGSELEVRIASSDNTLRIAPLSARGAEDRQPPHNPAPHAPWFVIPSDHKWFRNLAIARIVMEYLEALDMKPPRPSVDLKRIRREYHAAKVQ